MAWDRDKHNKCHKLFPVLDGSPKVNLDPSLKQCYCPSCRGRFVNRKTFQSHAKSHSQSAKANIIPEHLFDENQYLQDKFQKPLYEGSNVTLIDAVFQHLYVFSINTGMSKSAMSDALQTEKAHLPSPNCLPQTIKETKHLIKPLLMPVERYDACLNDCILYRNCKKGDFSKNVSCPECDSPRKIKNVSQKTYSYMPIGPRLTRWFGTANLCKLLYSGKCTTNGVLKDFTDGNIYKRLYSEGNVFEGYEEEKTIPLAMFTDGVNPNKHMTSQKSMWPILITWINLPIQIRQLLGPMLLVGIVPTGKNGREPQSLEPYVELLVDEILRLSEYPVYSRYYNAPMTVKVALIQFLCDIPAYSKLVHLTGHCGLRSCGYCKESGIYCKHLSKTIHLSNRQFLPEKHSLRTNTQFPNGQHEPKTAPSSYSVSEERKLREAFDNKPNKTQRMTHQKNTGLKGHYTLMRLPYHNRIEQMQPDGMHTIADFLSHLVDLLVGSKDNRNVRLCEKSFSRFKETWPEEAVVEDIEPPPRKKHKSTSTEVLPSAPWTLSKENIVEADRRASSIQYPKGIDITPGPHFSKQWTLKTMNSKLQFVKTGAFEWCIKGMLPSQQETTLFKVLDVLKRLSCRQLIASDIPKLQEDTHVALSLLERDFPLTLQVLVTHLIHHIAEGLPDNGPLYGRWLFPYERANGWMTRQCLKKGNEEATIMETYVIYDWCVYMMLSQKLIPAVLDGSNVRSAADFVREELSPGSHVNNTNSISTFGTKVDIMIEDRFFEKMKDFYVNICIPESVIPRTAVKLNSVEIFDKMTTESVRFNGANCKGHKTLSSVVELKGIEKQFAVIVYIIEHKLPHATFYWAVTKRLQNCQIVNGFWRGNGFDLLENVHPISNLSAPLVSSVQNGYVSILNSVLFK